MFLFQMTPTHISLNQCDGSCHQFGHSCIPTRVTRRSVPVLLSRCGIASGLCAKECASLEVEEHVECACACQLTARDCPPGQQLRPELCACQCADLPAKQACLDAGRTWREDTCSCACAEDTEELPACDEGYVFDRQQRCACVPLSISASSDLSNEADEATKHEANMAFPSVEIVVIAVLLAIILVLLSLVFSLVMRIQRMNRRLKGSSRRNNLSVKAEVIEEQEEEVAKNEEEELMIYTEVNCSTPSSGFYSEMGGQAGGCCGDTQQQQQQPGQQQQVYQRLQQQQQQIYQQQQQLYQPLYRLQADFDALYQSAEAVRLNKKLFAGHPMAGQTGVSPLPTRMDTLRGGGGSLLTASPSASVYSPLGTRRLGSILAGSNVDGLGYDRDLPASFPIDEAVRRLQMEGQQ